MNQLEVKKAFANLHALKSNLPSSTDIKEKYVHIFHNEIDRLSSSGFTGLNDFKIPESELKRQLTSWAPAIPELGQEKTENYSEDRYVERGILLQKIDALLTFFQVSSPEVEIGFKTD